MLCAPTFPPRRASQRFVRVCSSAVCGARRRLCGARRAMERGRTRDDRRIRGDFFRCRSAVLHAVLMPPRFRQILAAPRPRVVLIDKETLERVVAHIPLSPDPSSRELALLAQTRDIVAGDTEKGCGLTGRDVPDPIKKYFVVHYSYLQTARTRSNYYFTRYSGYPVDSGGTILGITWRSVCLGLELVSKPLWNVPERSFLTEEWLKPPKILRYGTPRLPYAVVFKHLGWKWIGVCEIQQKTR